MTIAPDHEHDEDFVPLSVVRNIELLRSSARRDRTLIVALILVLLLSLMFQSYLLILINGRANKVVKSNNDQATALSALSRLEDEQIKTEDLIRQLIICGRDTACQAQIITQLQEQQREIAAERAARQAQIAPTTTTTGSNRSRATTTTTAASRGKTTTTTQPPSTTTTTTTPSRGPLTGPVATVCHASGLC